MKIPGGDPFWSMADMAMCVPSALLLFYFNAWYLFILAVNTALIVGVAFMDWPSKSTLGA
jgi:hypothetical protein